MYYWQRELWQKSKSCVRLPKDHISCGKFASNAYKARTSEPPTNAKSATSPNTCTVRARLNAGEGGDHSAGRMFTYANAFA